jgi:Rod binding domain-containing protein
MTYGPAVPAVTTRHASEPYVQKARKAARQFEAQMIATLLGPVEKSFAAIPGEATDPGADNYQAMGVQALATQMAESGGLGIAALIMRRLAERGDLRPATIGGRATKV